MADKVIHIKANLLKHKEFGELTTREAMELMLQMEMTFNMYFPMFRLHLERVDIEKENL